MSPKIKVTRRQWLTALLAQGRVPGDMTLDRLCEAMGVSKGSFYSHFATLDGFYAEVIEQWQLDSAPDGLASSMKAVRDPLERLRLLHAHAGETARRDAAMRRWASFEPRAAAAVAKVDKQVKAYVAAALGDLGFPPAESAVLTEVLMQAFSGAFGFTGSSS